MLHASANRCWMCTSCMRLSYCAAIWFRSERVCVFFSQPNKWRYLFEAVVGYLQFIYFQLNVSSRALIFLSVHRCAVCVLFIIFWLIIFIGVHVCVMCVCVFFPPYIVHIQYWILVLKYWTVPGCIQFIQTCRNFIFQAINDNGTGSVAGAIKLSQQRRAGFTLRNKISTKNWRITLNLVFVCCTGAHLSIIRVQWMLSMI